uniref:Uncharacterized protein n=1 Tax=Anguilla anguilla TaxID=7936 RepID=A0A0E9WER1_ANGAN
MMFGKDVIFHLFFPHLLCWSCFSPFKRKFGAFFFFLQKTECSSLKLN